jgi:magnesium-transporting ATPase (P-type)
VDVVHNLPICEVLAEFQLEKAASMPIEEVFTDLKTSSNGLTSEEAKARLKQYGFNKLFEKRGFGTKVVVASFFFGLLTDCLVKGNILCAI